MKNKKTKKRKGKSGLLWVALLAVFCMNSCQEWGSDDDPAGNQVYPKLEQLLNLTFDEELNPDEIQLFAHPGGSEPTLVEDEEHGQVFHAQGGYARLDNPLNKAKVQNALSLTMWVKQAATEGQSSAGALFSFLDAEDKGLSFSIGGKLSYTGAEGSYEDDNPGWEAELTTGEWHYLAISITNTGYFVHVDSTKVIDKTVTGFDMSQMVQSVAALPYFYIAYGAGAQPGEIWLDDLKIYRNTISDKETAMPGTGGGKSTTIIVGEIDCSTAWWTAFSDFMSVPGDGIFHYKFRNYTAGVNNWDNWVLVVTNGKDREEAGYAEYFVLRADAFGWGEPYYIGGNITHNYNWDTFRDDMKGALVDLTLKREGGRVEMNAVITKSSGGVMNYSYFVEGIPAGAIGAFLTVESGYLEMDVKDISLGTLYPKGSYRVGNNDFSTDWWEAFSRILTANGDCVLNYQFYNYTNQANNWNNWLLVLTNGKDREEAGYAEHFVLRSDAYGWGDRWIGENIGNPFDWGTFKSDMDGAWVDLTIKLIGTRLDVIALITTTGGKTLEYTYFYDDFPTGALGAFLTVEGSYMDIISVSTCPFINK
jgi:hypothetical protein